MKNHLASTIKKRPESFKTSNGKNVEIHEIILPNEDKIISQWAKHFREQYCSQSELEFLIDGTEFKTKKEFLKEMIFPSGSTRPGPSIRSGDFGEVIVADYLEYIEKFWVPRNRFPFKSTRNESIKGSDIIGIKFKVDGDTSPEDVLGVFESKATLSKKSHKTLRNAVEHSAKDYLRLAHTLNAMKRRYLLSKDTESAQKIQRFQNLEDNPFKELFGAVAFCTTESIEDKKFFELDTSKHPRESALQLYIFYGDNLMPFVHKLYKVACDEAG